jgi:hypothetical protein
MTTGDLRPLEHDVLSWIRTRHPVNTTELLEEHRSERAQLTGESLRQAVRTLVDRGPVEYDYL